MTPQAQAIVDAALQLPEADRALIAERLLESISPDGEEGLDEEDINEEDLDEAWVQELDRRFAEFQQSEAGGLTWDEVKKLE